MEADTRGKARKRVTRRLPTRPRQGSVAREESNLKTATLQQGICHRWLGNSSSSSRKQAGDNPRGRKR
ncbi:hypothetical protein O3P69_003702 [Scylla paramamosain]|uniref:Uncharacterized protein n=1 Tax=Scylla paramamosain TaxID=85552 RepID=A0AAW0UDS8_SCYPA